MKILLIEDNQADADLLEIQLRQSLERFELTHAVRLEEGLARLAEQLYSILLLDLSLPDSHGLETFEQAHARMRNIPIVVLTSLNDEQRAIEALQMGAQDYLVKGQVTSDVLTRSINYAIARQEADLAHKKYIREHDVAESLQKSLLTDPDQLPTIAGTELCARYEAGGRGTQVGGDWYDVLPLPAGRLGLAMGDVAGRGIPAATVMGQLRSALRAYAIEGHGPADVVERLDRYVETMRLAHMATLVYAVFDPSDYSLSYVCAGHPPPLVITPDGKSHYLDTAQALPLGVVYGAGYREASEELAPGSILIMYTDGLVEQRGTSITDGLTRLSDMAIDGPEDLKELCDHLYDTVPLGGKGDDVAILAMRLVEVLSARLQMTLPAEGQVLASLRRTLARWLSNAGATDDEIYDIQQACGEAFANAIEHAYGPRDSSFDVEAEIVDGEAIVTVIDTGQWRQPRETSRGRGLQIIGRLMDSVDVAKGPNGTRVTMRKKLALGETQDA